MVLSTVPSPKQATLVAWARGVPMVGRFAPDDAMPQRRASLAATGWVAPPGYLAVFTAVTDENTRP